MNVAGCKLRENGLASTLLSGHLLQLEWCISMSVMVHKGYGC